ncbi:MAG: PTS sugar transporter subunit IIA [Psittacicella sp.]
MNLRESLVKNNSIALHQSVCSWEEAIKIGTDLLEKNNIVTSEYYKAIIASINKLGAYIVLAPGIAMPHARPEQGVLETGFALTTLDTPIKLEGEDTPIKLLITLAGSTGDAHIEGVMQITQILEDDEAEDGVNIEKFLNCNTSEEVIAIVDEALAKYAE